MRNKIIIGCLLLGALSAKAQDTRLSAVEYKERVLEYSRQIKQSSEERIAMQHAIKAAKTGFFPSVDSPAVISTVSINMIWISDRACP